MDLTENKDYIFMWGLKPVLPSFWASPEALKERKNILFPGKGLFQYFDGEVLTAYMRQDELDETKKVDSKKFLDPSYYEIYKKQYAKEYAQWWSWIRAIEKKDYTQVTKETLLQDHENFTKYQRDAIAYFGSTRPEPTAAAEERLKEILKNYVGENWPDTFGILTTPVALDDVQKEQLNFVKLIDEKSTDEDLLKHASTYPWLVFGQFEDNKIIEFLKYKVMVA